MNNEIVNKIEADPNYKKLVSERTSFSVKLGAFILAMYYIYILIIAFEPSILASKFGDGVVTIGYPIAAGIIIISFLSTLIYVKRANGEFEDLTDKIKDSVKDLS